MKMKFHIITYDSATGYNDKLDYNTRRFAEDAAMQYLKTHEQVYLIKDGCLDKVFNKTNPQGRQPYTYEMLKFRFK